MEIIIQPIEKNISNDILNLLSDSLSTEFNNVNVTIAPTLKVGIQNFINRQRNQLKSPVLLHYILERLKPEFYDLAPNDLVFYDRVTKEAVHELGHSFGLFHCNNKRCVMHFSNSLYDTDFKNRIFCKNCKNKL